MQPCASQRFRARRWRIRFTTTSRSIRDFLDLPHMGGLITDQHLIERDRLGRTLAFMARIVQDGWQAESRSIAIDRETAVLVDASGDATIVANADHPTPYAYFIRGGAPEICQPKTPLTYRNLAVFRAQPGSRFDIPSWSGHKGTSSLARRCQRRHHVDATRRIDLLSRIDYSRARRAGRPVPTAAVTRDGQARDRFHHHNPDQRVGSGQSARIPHVQARRERSFPARARQRRAGSWPASTPRRPGRPAEPAHSISNTPSAPIVVKPAVDENQRFALAVDLGKTRGFAVSMSFPNETSEYRSARGALLASEIALRRQMEAVAAQLRALPPGGEVPEDYAFDAVGPREAPRLSSACQSCFEVATR